MTSLQKLIEYAEENFRFVYGDYLRFQQALEEEEQQIKDAYNQGYRDGALDGTDFSKKSDIANYSDADNYYNTLKQ